MRRALAIIPFALCCAAAQAQDDLSKLMQGLAAIMDDAVLRIHRAVHKQGDLRPIENLDRALESQQEVLRTLDELLKQSENSPS